MAKPVAPSHAPSATSNAAPRRKAASGSGPAAGQAGDKNGKKRTCKNSNKTQPTVASVADFLATVTDPERRADCETVLRWMRAASNAEPILWGNSIVGFGRYRYQYASGREGEWPLIGFSPRKQDLTLYLMPGFEQCGELLQRLGKYQTGKSCLYLKRLADVDARVLQELIARAVAQLAGQRVD